MREMILHYIYLSLSIFLLLACREISYPPQLVEADSAYLKGDYMLADSLLDTFDTLQIAHNKPISMYFRLLTLEKKFVVDKLSEDDFAIADSLCRHYQDNADTENYAKSLLFRGDIYMVAKDYPTALKSYIEAADIAERLPVQCWAAQCEGDLYFKQEMYNECKIPYRRFFKISQDNRDTLRMAHASMRMGTVYTIEDKVDSTIAAFEKAIALSKHLHIPNNILENAQFRLCDIYIQLNDYEKARGIMPYDSLNMRNWADWHLGQNHLDSAKKYYIKLLKHDNLYAQASYLRTLSQIEMRQNHAEAALYYSTLSKQIDDSIKGISLVEETKLTATRHKIDQISTERDRLFQQQRNTRNLFIFISIATIAAIIFVYLKWRLREHQKNQEIFYERSLRLEEEQKNRKSAILLENNKTQLDLLRKQLNEVKSKDDEIERSKQTKEHERTHLIKLLHEKPLYLHIKRHVGENDFHLKADEWEQLGKDIDEAYNNFSYRLSGITSLSAIEMRACYLIKIGIAPADMALLLCTTRNNISMLRRRLYKKITQTEGTAKQLDEFILSF